jgi:Cof subfamily protein (haloacid dehalogenase superfamily)
MSEFSDVRLLIADVDGTLVTHDKVLTARAQAAARALKHKGIRLAITSGRPPRGMAMLVAPLALEEPIAAFNGGMFAEPDLSIIESHLLARDAASQAVMDLEKLGLDAWLYCGNNWFVRNAHGAHVGGEAGTVQFEPSVVESYDALLAAAAKIVGVSDDYPLVRRADTDLQRTLGARASVSRSQNYYLDITHPLANKAAVVDYHAARLGIHKEAICTIGDGPNDILMFRKSGYSIAMGNAADEVKAEAKVVTDSCDDEGFAKAVERYLLA